MLSVELETPVPVVAELLLEVTPVEIVDESVVTEVKVEVEIEVDGVTVMMMLEVIFDVQVKDVSVLELCVWDERELESIDDEMVVTGTEEVSEHPVKTVTVDVITEAQSVPQTVTVCGPDSC